MKSIVKTRNWIIVILCLTIVCLGVGFAILSMELDKSKENSPEFSVEFIKAEPRTPVRGGIQDPTAISSITNSNQTINLEFNLYAPRDEIGYKVTVKNTGNMKAEIINLVEKPDYVTDTQVANSIYPVKISHNNIVGKILEPGEEVELTITAIFNYNALQPQTFKIPYQLSIITKSPTE